MSVLCLMISPTKPSCFISLLIPFLSSKIRTVLYFRLTPKTKKILSSPSSFKKMRMSCNGCRVLRKGCSENCSIRPCLQWIKSAESQANATVFLAKFYGRAGLMNLLSTGPDHLRPGESIWLCFTLSCTW